MQGSPRHGARSGKAEQRAEQKAARSNEALVWRSAQLTLSALQRRRVPTAHLPSRLRGVAPLSRSSLQVSRLQLEAEQPGGETLQSDVVADLGRPQLRHRGRPGAPEAPLPHAHAAPGRPAPGTRRLACRGAQARGLVVAGLAGLAGVAFRRPGQPPALGCSVDRHGCSQVTGHTTRRLSIMCFTQSLTCFVSVLCAPIQSRFKAQSSSRRCSPDATSPRYTAATIW